MRKPRHHHVQDLLDIPHSNVTPFKRLTAALIAAAAVTGSPAHAGPAGTLAVTQATAAPHPAASQPSRTAALRPPAAKAAPPSKAAATPVAPPTPPLLTQPAFCAEAARRLPNLSTSLCRQAALIDSQARSVWGQPLWQRDVIAPEAKWRVLVIGGIHGDELSSSSLVFHWIQHALLTPSDIHWRFVPLVNPDGVLRPRPTRTNARGVDLNRNFPTARWNTEAPEYWRKRTKSDPRRYPGPTPLSEPESKWLHDEMERWKPHLVVAVHAPYGVLDFDGPAVPPQRLGRLYLDQVGIFPGSLGNWGGVMKKVPVVTIELNSAFRTPLNAEIRQMWLDLIRWASERLKT